MVPVYVAPPKFLCWNLNPEVMVLRVRRVVRQRRSPELPLTPAAPPASVFPGLAYGLLHLPNRNGTEPALPTHSLQAGDAGSQRLSAGTRRTLDLGRNLLSKPSSPTASVWVLRRRRHAAGQSRALRGLRPPPGSPTFVRPPRATTRARPGQSRARVKFQGNLPGRLGWKRRSESTPHARPSRGKAAGGAGNTAGQGAHAETQQPRRIAWAAAPSRALLSHPPPGLGVHSRRRPRGCTSELRKTEGLLQGAIWGQCLDATDKTFTWGVTKGPDLAGDPEVQESR
ncbi:uncharacterized protein LOC123649096 [Lemur catta]|uniref:uncharacterized protein LOC123649096 n=1 Tax=Lemur catta TaxID=9447 RepID=UPI001E26D1CE|nr:uncharacterized protein LOC123649096 [Lemur catta]